MTEENRLQDFTERYASGTIPWDDDLPPPELVALAEEVTPGRALDLGCGYGRSAIYLASKGWEVDGVDFVPQAVRVASERALKAGVAQRVQFHAASVSELGFLSGPFHLALDIGCMHSMSMLELFAYRDHLLRLLPDGAIYLLFAHLQDEQENNADEARWIQEETLRALFSDGFVLQHAEFGTTQVEDKPPWRSAWFNYRRRISVEP
ncbi:MAG: methyltransferase domain-containing protein [Chloroflexi bacterium]|jgi:cyclopropane fatty-acyl-phospholipid synthase-like methyltransferase|nr:methyltransferase domain-containing protein [Chloroflexota bacterium]